MQAAGSLYYHIHITRVSSTRIMHVPRTINQKREIKTERFCYFSYNNNPTDYAKKQISQKCLPVGKNCNIHIPVYSEVRVLFTYLPTYKLFKENFRR